MRDSDRLFAREAAAYVGLSQTQFGYRRWYTHEIRPAGRVGHYPWFSRDDLDALKELLQAAAARCRPRPPEVHHTESGERLYTLFQGAALLGISKQALAYRHRRGHIQAAQVVNGGPTGTRPLFELANLVALKRRIRRAARRKERV